MVPLASWVSLPVQILSTGKPQPGREASRPPRTEAHVTGAGDLEAEGGTVNGRKTGVSQNSIAVEG